MAFELLPDHLSTYLDELVPSRPSEMVSMEAYAEKTKFNIIGPASGHICYQIARMIGARRIFEMGSGYGYSTAWFAKAVKENGGGQVYHVVWDDKLSQMARQHLGQLGYGEIMTFRVSEAVKALRETAGPFDLIFNDIDKNGYPESLPVIASKLRPGGVLIVDNLLWHGRIFDPADRSPDTEGVRKFTQMMTTDPAWITNILPVRDGVLVALKQ